MQLNIVQPLLQEIMKIVYTFGCELNSVGTLEHTTTQFCKNNFSAYSTTIIISICSFILRAALACLCKAFKLMEIYQESAEQWTELLSPSRSLCVAQ